MLKGRSSKVFLVASVCALALPASASTGSADELAPGTQPNDSANLVLVASAQQLAQDQGVSLAEAEARILRQPAQQALIKSWAGQPSFGGAYLDQANGGQLVLQAVNPGPAALTLVAQSPVGPYARVASVANTWRTLDATRQQIAAELGSSADVEIDDLTNRVTVSMVNSPSSAPPTQMAAASSLRDKWGPNLVTLISPHNPEIPTSTGACYNVSCWPPLRGGVVMPLTTGGLPQARSAYCTVGFNVQSKTDTKAYVLSAGHCQLGSNTGLTAYAYSAPNQASPMMIGAPWRALGDAGSGKDAGIWSDTNSGAWSPAPYLLVHSATQPNETMDLLRPDMSYPCDINTYATACGDYPRQGLYVCHTGASSATQCGTITDGFPRSHFTALDCEGDSGGPVYTYYSPTANLAMGVTSSTPSYNAPNIPAKYDGRSVPCGSVTTSQRIETAASELNVKLLYAN